MGPKKKSKKDKAPKSTRSKAGRIATTTDIPREVWEENGRPFSDDAITQGREARYQERFRTRGVLRQRQIFLDHLPNSAWAREFIQALQDQGFLAFFLQPLECIEDVARRFIANLDVHSEDPPEISSYVGGRRIRNVTPLTLATTLGLQYRARAITANKITADHHKELKDRIIRRGHTTEGLDRYLDLTGKAQAFDRCCRQTLTPKGGDAATVPQHILHFVYALVVGKKIHWTRFIIEEWIRIYHGKQKHISFPQIIYYLALSAGYEPPPGATLLAPIPFEVHPEDEIKERKKGKRPVQEVARPSDEEEEPSSDDDDSDAEGSEEREMRAALRASREEAAGVGSSGAAPSGAGASGAAEGTAAEDVPHGRTVYAALNLREDMRRLSRFHERNYTLLKEMDYEHQSFRAEVRGQLQGMTEMITSFCRTLRPDWMPPPPADLAWMGQGHVPREHSSVWQPWPDQPGAAPAAYVPPDSPPEPTTAYQAEASAATTAGPSTSTTTAAAAGPSATAEPMVVSDSDSDEEHGDDYWTAAPDE